MFKQLLGLVSNMENEVPDDLQDLLLPHLTHSLYDHQLASLNFVRKVSTRSMKQSNLPHLRVVEFCDCCSVEYCARNA